MKTSISQVRKAFTVIEALVVIAVLVVLVAMLLPALSRAQRRSWGVCCNCNLKEIGTAYRLWANENGGLVPADQSVSNGGWKELLAQTGCGQICWTNFALMQNEMGQSPKLVWCPTDERSYEDNFTNGFSNLTLSYFIGIGASDVYPQSIAGGDRNLGPGLAPSNDYGFSPASGKGNDVAIAISGPVAWSLKMHSAGNAVGAGNILLGDGSAQQCSSAAFNQNWLSHDAPTTNWPVGHIPATPSVRLVFP